MSAADRTEGYQRLTEVILRHLCRSRSGCHEVLEVAVEGGHTSHQRMPRVKGTEREVSKLEVRRVVVGTVTVS